MPHIYFHKNESYKPAIVSQPDPDLGITVVIPSYNEPYLEKALNSLVNCIAPECSIEVITVINYPVGSDEETKKISQVSIEKILELDIKNKNKAIKFRHILAPDLPKKHAGVGLARKIGMDEAAWRFARLGKMKGIITCFDADSTCEPNYLVELEKLWKKYPETSACSIRYEHPLSGIDFNDTIYKGITQYELHLRYYNQASRYIGFPFAYHTVGSSMACSTEAYLKYGGMNRHQAGEDFYFLQKIIPHGNFRELNSTCVYPSPRPSYRVPFGTGRAMLKLIESNDQFIYTYNLESFLILKPFFDSVPIFYYSDNRTITNAISTLPQALSAFLDGIKAIEKIDEIKRNTSLEDAFRKRFFQWFNAFQLLKYLNHAAISFYPKKVVHEEAYKLGELMGMSFSSTEPYELLKIYRERENDKE